MSLTTPSCTFLVHCVQDLDCSHALAVCGTLVQVDDPPGSDDRPANIYFEERDAQGLPFDRTAYDVTVGSAHTWHHLGVPAREGGLAAAKAEKEKRSSFAASCAAQKPSVAIFPSRSIQTERLAPERSRPFADHLAKQVVTGKEPRRYF